MVAPVVVAPVVAGCVCVSVAVDPPPAASDSDCSTPKKFTASSVPTKNSSATVMNQPMWVPGKSGQRRGITNEQTSAKTMNPTATSKSPIVWPVDRLSSTARKLPPLERGTRQERAVSPGRGSSMPDSGVPTTAVCGGRR